VRQFYTISFLIFYSIYAYSQVDPQFTQFYSCPLYLSPSLAGATQQHRVASTYRNQWPGIPDLAGAFVTYTLSYDHYFSNFNSGVGLLILRDVAGSGDLSTTNVGLLYSYDIKVTEFFRIRPGIHFNYTQRGINFQKLLWGDQISPTGITPTIMVPSERSKPDIDFSTSVMAYTDRFWVGVSVDHLLRPNYSLYGDVSRLNIKYSLYGGYQVIRKGRLLKPVEETLSIAYLYKHQGGINQLDLGLYWYKNPLVFGFWYRGIPIINEEKRGDAIAFLVGYKIEQFSIGYSYDFTISKLLNSTGGSHEISLIYEFTTTHKKKKRHMVPCPEF
jgi:type IX secretion system PorP/SprF family membrane protein